MWRIYAFIIGHTVMDTWATVGGIDVANMRARAVYGDHGYAVDCTDYPVMVNDRYENQKFYRNGNEIAACTYPLVEMTNLRNELAQQSSAIDDLILAVTPSDNNGGAS